MGRLKPAVFLQCVASTSPIPEAVEKRLISLSTSRTEISISELSASHLRSEFCRPRLPRLQKTSMVRPRCRPAGLLPVQVARLCGQSQVAQLSALQLQQRAAVSWSLRSLQFQQHRHPEAHPMCEFRSVTTTTLNQVPMEVFLKSALTAA